MASYYLDENNKIKPELLESEAEKQAQKFSGLNTTQLRKFFNEVKALEKRLKDYSYSDEYFNELIPLIKMLKAKASYAYGRNNISLTFKNFIIENIDKIKSKNDFKAFILYFEAIVGYFYGLNNVKR